MIVRMLPIQFNNKTAKQSETIAKPKYRFQMVMAPIIVIISPKSIWKTNEPLNASGNVYKIRIKPLDCSKFSNTSLKHLIKIKKGIYASTHYQKARDPFNLFEHTKPPKGVLPVFEIKISISIK